MILSKVNAINYDKKDCNLVVCPQCSQSHFSVFEVVQKDADHKWHVHFRCVFCDLTWCSGRPLAEQPLAHGQEPSSPPGA
jgi:DNA-directed RNA polymerase subunit M/transcription elongation factor TFIIS